MDYYVARDEDGELFLFGGYPHRMLESWYYADSIMIDSNLFPEITWESEPVKVNLKLEKI